MEFDIPVLYHTGPSFSSYSKYTQPIYLDDDSAYQLARQAKEEALIHLKSETNLRTQIESLINKILKRTSFSLLLIVITTILIASSIVCILIQKSKQHVKKKIGNYYVMAYLQYFSIKILFLHKKCRY